MELGSLEKIVISSPEVYKLAGLYSILPMQLPSDKAWMLVGVACSEIPTQVHML